MAILQGKREKWCDLLENLIECPICCEIPSNNILLCQLGHHICISCRYQLAKCPICSSKFATIRNFLAEEICQRYVEIMMSLNIPTINETKKMKLLENKLSISTQTEKTSKSSVLVQTENLVLFDNKEIQCDINVTKNWSVLTPQSLNTKNVNLSPKTNYRCFLGSCIVYLPIEKIIRHLKFHHKHVFYEVNQTKGGYEQKFELEYVVSKNYDYAVKIKNLGLFFLNIKILLSGDIKWNVFLANDTSTCRNFLPKMTIGYKEKSIADLGLVYSCKDDSKISVCGHLIKKELLEKLADLNDRPLFNYNINIIKGRYLTRKNHDSMNHE